MIDKVYRYMKSCHMIPPGRRILVAVSGGADSMCLLEVLRVLQERAELKIRVLHVHHGLRESAEDDLQYVAKYCKEAGIPFQAVRVDAATRQDTPPQMDCLWKKRHVICGMKRSRRLLKSGTGNLIIPNAV